MEIIFVVIAILVYHKLGQALANTNFCDNASIKGIAKKPKNIVVIVADDLGKLHICMSMPILL